MTTNRFRLWVDRLGFFSTWEDTALTFLVVSLFVHWTLTLAIVFFCTVSIVLSPKRLRTVFSHRYSIFLLVVFGALGAYSLLRSNHQSALACLGIDLFLLVSFWLRGSMTHARLFRSLDLALASGFLGGGIALVQKFILQRDNLADYRPVGPTLNANFYGMLLSMVLLTALYRFLTVTNVRRRLFYVAAILFHLGILYLTESRSAEVGIVVGGFVLLLLFRRYKSCAALAGVGAALLMLGLSFPALFSWSNSLLYIFSERVALWKIAITGIFADPFTALFGRGLFSFPVLWENASRAFWEASGTVPLATQYHCHNLFLECVLSFGFCGFFAIGFYVAVQLRAFVARRRVRALRSESLFFLALCAMVLCESVVDAALLWVQTGLYFMLCYSAVGIREKE